MKKNFKKNVYVNKLTKQQLLEIIKFFKSKKLIGMLKNNNKDNAYTIYKYKNTSISIYKSNTIMVQGNDVFNICKELKLPNIEMDNQDNKKIIRNIPNEYFGCDEVGVGDYFGGIVCAMVYTNPSITKRLKDLGVDDSKKIKDDNMISKLANQIMNLTTFNVAEFTPAQYNDYYQSYPNANTIKVICHNTNIMQLQIEHIKQTNQHLPVIMDQFCPEKTYIKHLKSLGHGYSPLIQGIDIFETKAESKYIAVAAASILARYFFILQINNLEKIIYDKTQKHVSIPLGAVDKKNIKKVIDIICKNFRKENLKFFIKTNFKEI